MDIQEMNTKIEAVLKELTLEEKVGMLHGAQLFQTAGVERLQIPPLKMSDGPMGVRNEFDKSRWVTVGNEDDYVTYLPSNSAIAATWNRELAYETGKVLGEEARGRGKDVILAPGINIKRNPVCGRNFEYFSEDPYLVSALCVPMIQGIQEADVAACVKHFALNNQETERLWVNVEIDERALREIYLPGFLAAVKEGGSYSIMGAYNLFRGEHCCQSEALLDILRREWEYDGAVISDWGAVHDTKKAAESPLDVEMSVTSDFDAYFMANPLILAVKAGEVKEEVIDEKVRNILRLMLRLKMIEVAVKLTQDGKDQAEVSANPARKAGAYNTPAHREKTLEAARESIVLLKNEDNRLPLTPKKQGKLLVIGDNAKRRQSLGGGSAEIKALYEIVPLMGIKKYLGGSREVIYAQGYYVPEKKEDEQNWQADSIGDEKQKADQADTVSDTADNTIRVKEAQQQKKLREEAVALAKEAEDVIIIGGLNHEHDVEGRDRDSMALPYAQDELIEAVLSVNPNAVVVMFTGSPVSMQRWSGKAKAILWMSYCGMEGGTALAEILFGDVNPSGKLAETIPFTLEESSAYVLADGMGRALCGEEKDRMNAHLTESYTDGLLVGYRYYERKNVPVQFSFGYGLSYTTFSYSDSKLTRIEAEESGKKRIAEVSTTITNTGDQAGKEVVQVYVGKTDAAADEPVAELKGFEKVFLKPGESCEVTIPLYEDSFSFYDVEKKRFERRFGTYFVRVGNSLLDVKDTLEINL